jgi:2-dehydro-3-deoxyphosphogluconate aldolase/(4S)-4-hydroxy-2-oxoglutarate aldolase
MDRNLLLAWKKDPVIAVIRVNEHPLGINLAKAVVAGGIKFIEVTWNTPRAAVLIEKLKYLFPQCHIGTGTVLTNQALQDAIAVEADFVFCPHVDQGLIKLAQQHHIPIIPGASTPTEIVQAWQGGATAVKVFPIITLGGPTYLKALQGPLGNIPLIPTGGVTIANGPPLLQAGAIAIGLGRGLFPDNLIKDQNWPGITTITQTLLEQLEINNSNN